MKSFTYKRTPRQSFDAIRAELGTLLARLSQRLEARAAEFASDNRPSFEWLADEEKVLRYPAIALAVAGDRSAVERLDIEY